MEETWWPTLYMIQRSAPGAVDAGSRTTRPAALNEPRGGRLMSVRRPTATSISATKLPVRVLARNGPCASEYQWVNGTASGGMASLPPETDRVSGSAGNRSARRFRASGESNSSSREVGPASRAPARASALGGASGVSAETPHAEIDAASRASHRAMATYAQQIPCRRVRERNQ